MRVYGFATNNFGFLTKPCSTFLPPPPWVLALVAVDFVGEGIGEAKGDIVLCVVVVGREFRLSISATRSLTEPERLIEGKGVDGWGRGPCNRVLRGEEGGDMA